MAAIRADAHRKFTSSISATNLPLHGRPRWYAIQPKLHAPLWRSNSTLELRNWVYDFCDDHIPSHGDGKLYLVTGVRALIRAPYHHRAELYKLTLANRQIRQRISKHTPGEDTNIACV